MDLRSRPSAHRSEQKFQDDLAHAITFLLRKTVSSIPTPRILRGDGVWIPERAGREQERPFLNRIAHMFVHIDDRDDIAHLRVVLNVEGASSRAPLTAATSPWAALEEMGIEHTTSTSIAAELEDTGHQLGRKMGQETRHTHLLLVNAVSHSLGYESPRLSTAKEMLGDGWGSGGGCSGGGWTVYPIPDLFFLM